MKHITITLTDHEIKQIDKLLDWAIKDPKAGTFFKDINTRQKLMQYLLGMGYSSIVAAIKQQAAREQQAAELKVKEKAMKESLAAIEEEQHEQKEF